MNFARRVYLIAGIYGLIALIPQYFLEGKTGRDFPPPITHPEFFYGLIGVAIAWQLAFIVISRDPLRYRPIMPVTVCEKAGYGIAVVILYLQGRVATPILITGIIDLVIGQLFLMAYWKTRNQQSSQAVDI